jgi:hypothetical protein
MRLKGNKITNKKEAIWFIVIRQSSIFLLFKKINENIGVSPHQNI